MYELFILFFAMLDIFEIKGKLTELPYSAYANFSAKDVWTFTFSAASPIAAVKALLAVIVVYCTMV